MRVLHFWNTPPSHVLMHFKKEFHMLGRVRTFWIDRFSLNMTIARHVYITSWTSLKLLPVPVIFKDNLSNWYILLRQVLCETRLHHWITSLKLLPVPDKSFWLRTFSFRHFEGSGLSRALLIPIDKNHCFWKANREKRICMNFLEQICFWNTPPQNLHRFWHF